MDKDINQSDAAERFINSASDFAGGDKDAARKLLKSPIFLEEINSLIDKSSADQGITEKEKQRIKEIVRHRCQSLETNIDQFSSPALLRSFIYDFIHHLIEIALKSIKQAKYPLRGTLLYYNDPTAPVGEDDWNAMK